MAKVKVIRKGETHVSYCAFEELEEGDTFFVNGTPHVAVEDAHYSGDASYDGYLIHDDVDGWFPEELDGENDADADGSDVDDIETANTKVYENIVNIAIMAANLVAEGRAELDDYEGFTGFTQAIIQMAKNFEKEHANVDFNDGNRDYWEEIDQYAREKLLERYGVEEQKPGAEIKVIMDRGCVQTVLKNSDLNVHVEIISCDPDYDDNEKLQAYAEEIQDDSEFRDCDYHVAAFQEGTPESSRFCYFEVCVSPDTVDNIFAEWMCIKAFPDQTPVLEEMETFLRDCGWMEEGKRVCFINEIDEAMAREDYDFDEEELWPVFGRNKAAEGFSDCARAATDFMGMGPVVCVPDAAMDDRVEELIEIPTPNRITEDMVKAGYSAGIITLEVNPDAAGVVCRIGEHWFYFGGETAESYRSADAFKEDIPEEDIIREICDTLDAFLHDADTYMNEYAYYYFYLREQLSCVPAESGGHSIRLYYGYEESDYGVSLSFRTTDPAAVNEARMIDELAAELDISPEDHHFHWNSIDITLPESLVQKIKEGAIQEYKEDQK